jgi:phosphoglycolate phosphatase
VNRRNGLRGVLLDLDGTLLDTAPDMAEALNRLRADEGLPGLPFERIRPHVSHGALRLIRLGFSDSGPERIESLRTRYLDIYRQGLAVRTRLFDGFEAVLAAIERAGLCWGVVTNKPDWLAAPLLEALALGERSACLVAGDTLAERKPHPMPLLHAASLMKVEPGQCLYVGDAERDVQAARNAGMIPLVAGFGYLDADEDPAAWHPDGILGHPAEILDWLGLRN